MTIRNFWKIKLQGIIFIGPQASGKSTFYLEKFYKTHVRLSMDMLKTRHRENLLFNACLTAKQPVVIDNTNPTKLDRKKYIEGFKKHHFEVIGYYFSSSLDDCLNRNALRKDKENIPDIGIKGTYNKLEVPDYEEGFERLFHISLNHKSFNVTDWEHEL